MLEKIVAEEAIIPEKDTDIISNTINTLRCDLNKQQRRLLLHIIDEFGLTIDKTAYTNYQKGFTEGIMLAANIFYCDAKNIDKIIDFFINIDN